METDYMLNFNFSLDEAGFAKELKVVMDNIIKHRDIFKENAIIIPHKYASAIANVCEQLIPAVSHDTSSYLVCKYKDIKIFASKCVDVVHFIFQDADSKLSNADIYKPFIGTYWEKKDEQ